jgi:fatty-acyl-CoA synthase
MAVRSLSDVAELERTPLAARGLPRSTIAALQASALTYRDKVALRFIEKGLPDDPVNDLTYAELFRRVVQAANLFCELGVGPQDSVSMLLPLAPETVIAMFGAQAAGMANPINFLLEPHQIASLLAEARCRVALAPDPDFIPGIWPKVEAALAAMPEKPKLLRVGGPRERQDIYAPSFAGELDRQPADALTFLREIGPGDIASLFHTGGTTALPKLARHTHGALTLHSWASAEMLGYRPDDVWLLGLPMFHVGGATCATLTALTIGGTLAALTPAGLRNPNVVRNLWALVQRFRATVVGMVPTSWGAAMNVPTDGFDLGSIRVCVSGGAALPVEIARVVERKLGKSVAEGWGMTELHGWAALNPAAGECRVGSVGLRTPYTDLIVAHVKDGRVESVAEPGEIGRVLARGPQLFTGYANQAHEFSAWIEPAFDDKAPAWVEDRRWFDTGDLGRFDEDGYLWLTGRAKDLIIRGGHNIDPVAIEESLYRHPAVEAVAAVGRPDVYAGEIPVAFVQLKPGAAVSPAELQAFARERIVERAAAPAEIYVVPQLPLTGVGKIFKPALRQLAAKSALEVALAELPEAPELAVVVAPHPKYGSLAIVSSRQELDPARAEAIRSLLGRFQLRYELVEPGEG